MHIRHLGFSTADYSRSYRWLGSPLPRAFSGPICLSVGNLCWISALPCQPSAYRYAGIEVSPDGKALTSTVFMPNREKHLIRVLSGVRVLLRRKRRWRRATVHSRDCVKLALFPVRSPMAFKTHRLLPLHFYKKDCILSVEVEGYI